MKHPLIGTEFHVDFQPYGPVLFRVEQVKLRRYRDYRGVTHLTRDLKGTVIKGSVTSRLLHATSTRHIDGEPYSLSSVSKREALAGRAIKVAM